MSLMAFDTIKQSAVLLATSVPLLCAALSATPASALDDVVTKRDIARIGGVDAKVTWRDAVESRDDSRPPSFNERLRETFGRIPLRPVRIGTTPRMPDDPEPGMGLVLRLSF